MDQELCELMLKKLLKEDIEKEDPRNGTIQIVVLQRGWIVVGKFNRNGSYCEITESSVIRRWGTSKGLGELAENGPLENTKLDQSGIITTHLLEIVCCFSCNQNNWRNKCK